MFPISRFKVSDRSMEPTLNQGDFLLVNTWVYFLGRPAQGDILVYRGPSNGKFLVKRVSKVEEGRLLVAGDNKKESTSGWITEYMVVGKVWKRIAPKSSSLH